MTSMDVSIGFIKQNDTYILQRRSADPEKGAAGLIGAFGGKIEPGESPVEAVCRELSEETSLRPSTEDFEFLGQVSVIADRNHQPVQIMAHVFRISIPQNQAIQAYEGELVVLTSDEAHTQYHQELTPATCAAFEQII